MSIVDGSLYMYFICNGLVQMVLFCSVLQSKAVVSCFQNNFLFLSIGLIPYNCLYLEITFFDILLCMWWRIFLLVYLLFWLL